MEVYETGISDRTKTQPSISKMKAQQLTIQIQNNSDNDISITQDTIVGFAKPVSPNSTLILANVTSKPYGLPPGRTYPSGDISKYGPIDDGAGNNNGKSPSSKV